ncbi:MAG: glycosyl hydrolase family protein [Ruminococcaceae bacterium]|nr:glycosyl hydrolase family protein [Oscillospiraceae bacterium]
MKRISDKFLCGAMYAPFCRTRHAPMEEWQRDMDKMAELGFTCLHGFAEWHDIEYKKGVFDFSKIDHFVECADKAGLAAIINIATQNSVGFYSPRWLMEELRDSEGFVDSLGRKAYHSEYVVPCLDDPHYKQYSDRYLTGVARHFAGDDRVKGYVIWGEPTLQSPFPGERICYCKHTLAKFRVYLENKYKKIEDLNEAWGSEGCSEYSSFSEVYPPTGYSRQRGGYASWDDFCEFMEQNLASHIINANRIFKENGATQPTVTEMLPGIANSVASDKLAKTSDIVGISLFGKPTRKTALYMSKSASLAKMQNKTSFVIEAGGGSIKFDNPAMYDPQAFTPSAEELKTTVLMRAGFGTKGVMFWCWRPRLSDMEGNDFGMCRPDGKPLKRTIELGKLSKRMYELSDVYNSVKRISEVAIFTSQKINHIAKADRMDGCYVSALSGASAMLTDLHINSDFVSDEDVVSGVLKNYKALLLPSTYVISEECAQKIEEFVRLGGRVIADYILAEKKPGGFCYTTLPGAGLDKVFGIEREDVLFIAHKNLERQNSFGIRTGNFVEEVIPVTASSVDEDYGENYPLLTENKYFDGYANYISTQYFGNYERHPEKALRDRIAKLLAESGIYPYAQLECEDGKELTSLITAALMKNDGTLGVFTVSNTTYDIIHDKVHLPKGKYCSVEENARFKLYESETETVADIELSAMESIAFYKVQ